MTSSERFKKILSGEPVDRAPNVEWAGWWNLTLDKWREQGLAQEIEYEDLNEYLGNDGLCQRWLPIRSSDCPKEPSYGVGIISNEDDYHKIKKYLYGDSLLEEIYQIMKDFHKREQETGCASWYTLEGFFWFPRTLFGIEEHLYSFYDYPELLEEINQDLCAYYKKALEAVYAAHTPNFMTIAEDMSYNHGPMCSEEQFDTFILPYYKELTPIIKSHGTKVFIDTDGFVEPLIPWFLRGGVEGVLPLERMAGVDVNRIRKNYPELLMLGGFDKTVMHLGEEAMRKEFERILPAIRSGRYVPAVDHQTPPDVTLENYRIFQKLLREYSAKVGQ